jgi:tetraacyldisaccharide 4'-kinase
MGFLHIILLPISFCYGLVMSIRNWMFNTGILKSTGFDVPIISIGNLSAGGTGKTPHIEYLVRLLKDRFFIATLSRGYGRNSAGYILASRRSNYKYIGDEPMQFVLKFPEVKVAVDNKRERGINSLLAKFSNLNAILLDDAFQHRRVRPGLSILLTDYHRLYSDDHVLPSGMLREFPCGARRADVIVVTKTPKVFSPITRRRIIDDLRPRSHQEVFFSYLVHLEPVPAFDCDVPFQQRYPFILLFTGIANDDPLREHLERRCTELIRMKFCDHHPYTEADLLEIKKRFDDLPTQKKVIVTTEKDMMRLRLPEFSHLLKGLPIYYIPIEAEFHAGDKPKFDKIVLDYVEQNSGVKV